MALPSADTPLYNHSLPDIEQWLKTHGCEQNRDDIHCWHIAAPTWSANIWMEIDCFVVRYVSAGDDGADVQRSFKYSLSRQDLEDAIFAGP